VSGCTKFPESRSFVFNLFPGFNCIIAALKSRIIAGKSRTKLMLKFVRDISTKMPLCPLYAVVSFQGFECKQLSGFRNLSAAKQPRTPYSGNLVQRDNLPHGVTLFVGPLVSVSKYPEFWLRDDRDDVALEVRPEDESFPRGDLLLTSPSGPT
jgi:hypothetical protein